jgi:hypothetical protein
VESHAVSVGVGGRRLVSAMWNRMLPSWWKGGVGCCEPLGSQENICISLVILSYTTERTVEGSAFIVLILFPPG